MSSARAADSDDIARLPILVGFTGRREFSKDPAENQRLLGIVSDRFIRCVEWLDAELPLTPKVLICGGDAGSDLAAVTALLSDAGGRPDHPLWSVVLKHAFAGYEPEGAAVEAYKALLARYRGRINQQSLEALNPKIRSEDDSTCKKTGDASKPETPQDLRAMHFEQHALWLARYATILVTASAPASAILGPAKPGATARLVAYRRADVPDDYAACVIERSEVLLAGSPLDEPDGGHILWINPTEPDQWPPDLPPVRILGPIQEHYDQRLGSHSLEQARDALYREPFREIPEGGRSIAHDPHAALESAIEVGRQFEHLYRRTLPWHQRVFGPTAPNRPAAAAFSGEAPHEFLKRLRARDAPIGRQQLRAHETVRWSLRGLIIAFLVAVVCYEGYIELEPNTHGWLGSYVAVLFLIGAAVWIITWMDAARRTEDLRGLREVLRVQIAWWASGIDRMVDRVHLRSIDNDLKIIREIAATISMWAILRTSAGVPIGTCNFNEASAWVNEQVKYHHDRWVSNDGFKQLSQQGAKIGAGTAWVSLLAMFLIFVVVNFKFDVTQHVPSIWISLMIAVWIALAIRAAADFTEQFTDWRLQLRWPQGSWETATALAIAVVALPMIVMPFVPASEIDLPGQLELVALLAILLILVLTLFWAVRMEWTTKDWKVTKMLPWHQRRCIATTSGFLLGLALILAPAAPWIGAHPNLPTDSQAAAAAAAVAAHISKPVPPTPEDVKGAFRALMLTVTTLLLAASGMLRYYVERRNHAAQAAQSDDCHRAFLRAQAILARTKAELDALYKQDPPPLPQDLQAKGEEARKIVREIGELALVENEAWLRAHRERPVEAIS